MSTHQFVHSVITHTLQLCAVLVLVLVVVHHDQAEQGVRHTVQVVLDTEQSQVQEQEQEQEPITVTDPGDQVWWTTTDCPAGVAVPCLDPTLTPAQVAALPAWVEGQYRELRGAEWRCIAGHGVSIDGDDPVYVPAPVLSVCRAAAYAVVNEPAGAVGNGCWLENLGSTELPAWTWLAEWTSDGLCPGTI